MRILVALLLTVPLLSGCFGGDKTVTLLVADGTMATSPVDLDVFIADVKGACEDCKVVVHDAEGDADTQSGQVRKAVSDTSDVVVIWPVDPEAAESYDFGEAQVVSLVQLVPGSDRFVGLSDPIPAEAAEQGTELAAAHEVILGKRKTMTHLPAREIGARAAQVATALLAEESVEGSEDFEGVQSWLHEPTEVTVVNLTTVLVGGGLLTLDELCSSETLKRCRTLGLV